MTNGWVFVTLIINAVSLQDIRGPLALCLQIHLAELIVVMDYSVKKYLCTKYHYWMFIAFDFSNYWLQFKNFISHKDKLIPTFICRNTSTRTKSHFSLRVHRPSQTDRPFWLNSFIMIHGWKTLLQLLESPLDECNDTRRPSTGEQDNPFPVTCNVINRWTSNFRCSRTLARKWVCCGLWNIVRQVDDNPSRSRRVRWLLISKGSVGKCL